MSTMSDIDVLSKEIQTVVNRAAKMEEERVKAQTRFETAKEGLTQLGIKSLAEAKEKLASLETEIAALQKQVEDKLQEIKKQLDGGE